MKINISKKFLIFNAHQKFLDEFFKDGINYSYSGVDLGLGVIFVTSIDEVEVNSSLFLPLFKNDSFLWVAYSINPQEIEQLSEEQIIDTLHQLGLHPTDSVTIGTEWHMTKFIKQN